MNITVVAPHPDDETLGCGGTICRFADRGDVVTVAWLSSGELGLRTATAEEAREVREQEAIAAARVLGVAETFFLRAPDWFVGDHIEETAAALRPVLFDHAPDLVLLPQADDNHPDHRAAIRVLTTALGSQPAPMMWFYEVWTPLASFDVVEDVTSEMERKLEAVRCYASQLSQFSYDTAVEGLNRYRGELAAKCRYAEVFRSRALGASRGYPTRVGAANRPCEHGHVA